MFAPADRRCRMPAGWLACLSFGLLGFACDSRPAKGDSPGLPTEQRFLERAKAFTPLPPAPWDRTNRFLGRPESASGPSPSAAEIGHRLFFDQRLSGNGEVSCATCHDPNHGFADPRPLADGMGKATRHAPTLLNVAHHRWFGWGGRADSLWSQALGPLEAAHEMGGNRASIAGYLWTTGIGRELGVMPSAFHDPNPSGHARPALSGESAPPAQQVERWEALAPEVQRQIDHSFASVGMVLAAYQRELVTGPSPFDRYVAALAAGEPTEDINFGDAERRGFELFAGKARCFVCHSGPFFSDGEFHNTGAPPLHGGEPEDPGRYRDGKLLQTDPFNATGEFSADREGQTAERTRLLKIGSEQWGEFKTPTLRNVALTPPYMHQGQFETLEAVVAFYDTLENSVGASHHQEQILQPIGLTEAEKADLVSFLRSLTGTPVPEKWTRDPFQ